MSVSACCFRKGPFREDLLKEDELDRGADVGSGVCIDDDRCMELTISDDVEPEPEGCCDGNDVYARGDVADHMGDACVDNVNNCMNSLDDVFDEGF